MKFRFIPLFLLTCLGLAANTHLVDNTSQQEGVFTSLQEAIDQAAEGDTIFVKGTSVPYEDGDGKSTLLTKRLVLIGEGPYKTEDGAVNEGEFTFITWLILKAGENTSPNGTVIKGFHLERLYFSNNGSEPTTFSDIELYNNEVDRMEMEADFDKISGLTMVNNLFYPSDAGFDWSVTSDVDFRNNFLHFRKIFRPTEGENILKNNVIVVESTADRTAYGTDGSGGTLYEREWETENVRYENNIFFMAQDGPDVIDRLAFKASNVELINNLALNVTDVRDLLESGNVANTVTNLNTESDPFMNNDGLDPGNFPFLDLVNASRDYRLRDDSIGKAAGTDGKDVGVYGGDDPWPDGPNHRYELGTPLEIPVIELLESSKTVVKPGEGLKVRIKAKANN